MKRKTVERSPSLISLMSQGIRDKGFMMDIARRLQTRAAKIKPGRLRWYFFTVLLVIGLAEAWLCSVESRFRSRREQYRTDHAAVTPVQMAPPPQMSSFRERWDMLMADSVMKRSWEGLLLERPGLADTVRELEKMDSADRAR
jgi:hypothetical protein